VALAGELDHPRAHVDAEPARRTQCREQVAAAGADLEHGRVGRDEEAVDRLEQPVVGAVAAPPAVLDGGELVEEAADRVEVLPLSDLARARNVVARLVRRRRRCGAIRQRAGL